MYLSVVVPCFNEEESIGAFLEELKRVLEGLGVSYEVICINDGSQDSTEEIIKNYPWPNLKCHSFTRNFGHQAALAAGYEISSGDYVVTLDSDLQHPPPRYSRTPKGSRAGF